MHSCRDCLNCTGEEETVLSYLCSPVASKNVPSGPRQHKRNADRLDAWVRGESVHVHVSECARVIRVCHHTKNVGYICVCVCVCVYKHTHIHTHTYISVRSERQARRAAGDLADNTHETRAHAHKPTTSRTCSCRCILMYKKETTKHVDVNKHIACVHHVTKHACDVP
jgi:hypothetical protein